MIGVLDASSVVAYLLGEASEDERAALIDEGHAPSLVDIEVTQTLRGLLRSARIDLAKAERGRDELVQLTLRRHPDAPLLRRSWELRDVCSVYDAQYVALAEALGATLYTRDARLARGVAGLIEVAVSV